MEVSDSSAGPRHKILSAAPERFKPQRLPSRQPLGACDREWSAYRSVSASPLAEHLALVAGDALLAICSLSLLLLIRPSWYLDVSEDTRTTSTEQPRPSFLYVMILSLFCGFGGALMKALVALWCYSQMLLRTTSSKPIALRSLLQAGSLGDYSVCPRVVASLFCYWVCITAAFMQLLGAPLDALPSSLVLGVVFATVGFLSPYAHAVAEACRSSRWEFRANPNNSDKQLAECSKQNGATEKQHLEQPITTTFPAGAAVAGGLGRAGGAVAFVSAFLRILDFTCLPVVLLARMLQQRRPDRKSSAQCLSPRELGNLLVFLSVFPLVACCLMCLISCIFLPMDWPTVYVVYPSPLVIFLSLGYPAACCICFWILVLLPVSYTFPSRFARATPVLQEMMLKPNKPFSVANAVHTRDEEG